MDSKYEERQEKASLSIFTLTEVHSWVNVVWVHTKEEPLQNKTAKDAKKYFEVYIPQAILKANHWIFCYFALNKCI